METDVEYEFYGEEGMLAAAYCRLAVCEDHGLEGVTGHRLISTGYDKCYVGVFICGKIVTEDVF